MHTLVLYIMIGCVNIGENSVNNWLIHVYTLRVTLYCL